MLPLRQAGKTIRAIAQELGISRRAVQRILKAAQEPLADFCPTEPYLRVHPLLDRGRHTYLILAAGKA